MEIIGQLNEIYIWLKAQKQKMENFRESENFNNKKKQFTRII